MDKWCQKICLQGFSYSGMTAYLYNHGLRNLTFLLFSHSSRFAFAEITRETIAVWFSLDYLMDLIYFLDIVFHFRTGYLEVR